MTIEFAVSRTGSTEEVSAIDGPAMLRKSAEEFVKTWLFDSLPADRSRKYRAHINFKAAEGIADPRIEKSPRIESTGPYDFDYTVIVSDITLSDCPTGADEDVPRENNADDFVEIERSSCMGSCPAYSLKVQADGAVSWDGGSSVKVIGKRGANIDPTAARGLLEEFRTKDFWSYCGSYSRMITDSSSTSITVKLGGKTRTISDYAESSPAPLQNLLLEVDRVTDSHQWRHGDPAGESISQMPSDAWLPKPGVTPLMVAAGRNEVDLIKTLIRHGADVSATDSSGWTALMYASFVSSDFPTKLLLSAGANPNQSSPHGDTPLMVAAAFGEWDSNLLDAGAKINAQNSVGQTALMYLASRGAVDAIAEALHAGANASLKDRQGRTPLDYLKLANCGRSPFYNPVEDWMVGPPKKCTALWGDNFKKSSLLLRDAMRKKRSTR